MKRIWLLAALISPACSNSSKKDPAPAASAAPAAKQGDSRPIVSQPDPVKRADPVKKPGDVGQAQSGDVPGCSAAVMPGSDHNLAVSLDKDSGRYLIDFATPGDRALHVIALYVTAPEDAIPTFKNGFKFKGAPYWMVAVEKPFTTYFQLPILYGTVSGKALDVSKNYKGLEGGQLLGSLTAPTCLKITVVTFEADQEQSFKSSEYQLSYKP